MDDSRWDEIPDPPRYYNREGKPLSLRQWSDLYDDLEYKRVASTQLGPYWISTVWLGLDHSLRSFTTAFGSGDPVLIFETMVFDRSSGQPYRSLEMDRYTTEAEARRGHDEMVQLVQDWPAALPPQPPQLPSVED